MKQLSLQIAAALAAASFFAQLTAAELAQGGRPSAREGIAAMNHEFEEAFASGNAEAIADQYTKDAQSLKMHANPICGRAAIKADWERSLLAIKGAKVSIQTVEVQETGDWAYEIEHDVQTFVDGSVADLKWLVIWKFEDGKWRVHREIGNDNPSSGPSAKDKIAEEEAIKKAIRTETECFYARDPGTWQGTWLHDARATRTVVANNSYDSIKDWDKFGPELVQSFKQWKPAPIDLSSDNYIIRVAGDLAWVEYDQYVREKGADPKQRRFSREYRVMVKQDGVWKIASQITHDPETFTGGYQSIEGTLNSTGYHLLAAKKTKEAIDAFELNVRLFPDSANVYDSLGEAYAAIGDKSRAIKNYEKSLELDPKRESGKAALAKLKE
jgi:uncharacterized protein (TIGR02246 family)